MKKIDLSDACTLDTRGIFLFEMGVSIFVTADLWEQWYYLRGPSVQSLSIFIPLAASVLGLVGAAVFKVRKFSVSAILALLYIALIQDKGFTQSDSWLWVMGIAYLGIPRRRDASSVESVWCALFKATGFLVYLFAGLQKAIYVDWWTGRTLATIFTDPLLIISPFDKLAAFPGICQSLGLLTLFQRLVVPWGLWVRKPMIRKSAVIVLVLMHVSYLFSLRIGLFSWTGILYLLPLWFTPRTQNKFQEKYSYLSRTLAGLTFIYLLGVPSVYFLNSVTPHRSKTMLMNWIPPGFQLRWGMFATYFLKPNAREAVWDQGGTHDYFRRRFYLSFPPSPLRVLGPYRPK